MRVSWRRLASAVRYCAVTAGVFVLASGGFRGSGFTESEFECEQAVAHLHGCCPDFPVRAVNCDYQAGCGEDQPPWLTIPASKCIQNTSCDEAQEYCDFFANLQVPADAGADYEPPKAGACFYQ